MQNTFHLVRISFNGARHRTVAARTIHRIPFDKLKTGEPVRSSSEPI